MRPHLLALALACTMILPTALAQAVPLFEDARGDAAPGGEGWADLVAARANLAPSGSARFAIDVASLAGPVPADAVWGVEWSMPNGTRVGVGWQTLVLPFPPFFVEGGYSCAFADPPSAPACTTLPGERLASGFVVDVPANTLPDSLANVTGYARIVPEATVFPLFVLEFTGATVFDAAQGSNVTLAAREDAAARASGTLGERDVVGPAVGLAALAIAGCALATRRR